MRLFNRELDFVYLAPALLFNGAFICGIIPAMFCVDGTLFAYISIAIFVISIVAHIYIMFHWQRYQECSPVAYALIQPALHFMVLVFALAVGATSICEPVRPHLEAQLEQFPQYHNTGDMLEIYEVISINPEE